MLEYHENRSRLYYTPESNGKKNANELYWNYRGQNVLNCHENDTMQKMQLYFGLKFCARYMRFSLSPLIFLFCLVCLCEPQSFLLEFVRPVSLQIMTCLPEDLGLSGTPCSTYGLSGTALHSLHTCTQTPAYSRSQMHVCASCY